MEVLIEKNWVKNSNNKYKETRFFEGVGDQPD